MRLLHAHVAWDMGMRLLHAHVAWDMGMRLLHAHVAWDMGMRLLHAHVAWDMGMRLLHTTITTATSFHLLDYVNKPALSVFSKAIDQPDLMDSTLVRYNYTCYIQQSNAQFGTDVKLRSMFLVPDTVEREDEGSPEN